MRPVCLYYQHFLTINFTWNYIVFLYTHKLLEILTGSCRPSASTGWWNGQEKLCLHIAFMTTLCKYWSWLVKQPVPSVLMWSGGGGLTIVTWSGFEAAIFIPNDFLMSDRFSSSISFRQSVKKKISKRPVDSLLCISLIYWLGHITAFKRLKTNHKA